MQSGGARSADFQICCIADFPIGNATKRTELSLRERSAGWKPCDTNKADEYLGSQMAEEISSALTKLRELRGLGQSTAAALKSARNLRATSRQLALDAVLTGRVRTPSSEFYTEGAYVSGDLDMCVISSSTELTVRLRQEIMAPFGATGGPRSWQVGGIFIDVLGTLRMPRALPSGFCVLRLAMCVSRQWKNSSLSEFSLQNILKTARPLGNVLRRCWRRRCKRKSRLTGMRSNALLKATPTKTGTTLNQ